MRLALIARGADSTPVLAVLIGDGLLLDVGAADRLFALGLAPAVSIKALAERGDEGLRAVRAVVAAVESIREAGHDTSKVTIAEETAIFLPPVPDPSKFLAIGKNYRAHLAELERNGLIREMPDEPTGFIKLNAVIAPHRGYVRRPEGITTFDYEPELAFIIGKRASGVSADQALGHVLGITAFNDMTAREIQKREVETGTRFWTAKNMPGFGPLGPYVVTLDEVPDLSDIWISCAVNGEKRLRFSTRDQIHSIPTIIEHFSRYIPLEPGDVMATGCQEGTAFGQPNAAELFLKPGDAVEVTLEGFMTLRTHVI
ncbi:fumarylacetoacetate hydrolase family protein [Pelagibacterium sediminicola]|uniref:fumarylacetoacetate hydrolase family protein n=1 Tax=Pelagibacterium sediminicola TaxID=2248761 RepID=UPI001300298D|nr:fumarylacetoacetate hydrolase family protein [Pelagibacterium sediminicola]